MKTLAALKMTRSFHRTQGSRDCGRRLVDRRARRFCRGNWCRGCQEARDRPACIFPQNAAGDRVTPLSAFVARPEFSPHGFYVELDEGSRTRKTRGWAFIPSPLPPPSEAGLLAALLEPASLSLRPPLDRDAVRRRQSGRAHDTALARYFRFLRAVFAFRPDAMERWLCELQDVLAAGGGITHPERGLRTTGHHCGSPGQHHKRPFSRAPSGGADQGLARRAVGFHCFGQCDAATAEGRLRPLSAYLHSALREWQRQRSLRSFSSGCWWNMDFVGDLILPGQAGRSGPHGAVVGAPLPGAPLGPCVRLCRLHGGRHRARRAYRVDGSIEPGRRGGLGRRAGCRSPGGLG